jgi:hypothetical protein
MMSTPLTDAIRERLGDYLAGQTTLDELEAWFVPATWDVEQAGDPAAVSLTGKVLLVLAEFSHGDWTEEEVRDLLGEIADPSTMRPYTIDASAESSEPMTVTTDSGTSVIILDWQLVGPPVVFGTPRVMASG